MSLYSSCLETWDAWTIPWQSLATVWNWKTEALLRLLPQWSGCTRWQSHSFLLGYSAVGVVDGWYKQLRQLFLFCFTFAFIGIDSSFIEPIFRAASYFQHEQVMPGYRFFLDITHQSSSSLFSSTLEPKAQISWSAGHYSDWTRVSVSPWCWWWPPQLTLWLGASWQQPPENRKASKQAGEGPQPCWAVVGRKWLSQHDWATDQKESIEEAHIAHVSAALLWFGENSFRGTEKCEWNRKLSFLVHTTLWHDRWRCFPRL